MRFHGAVVPRNRVNKGDTENTRDRMSRKAEEESMVTVWGGGRYAKTVPGVFSGSDALRENEEATENGVSKKAEGESMAMSTAVTRYETAPLYTRAFVPFADAVVTSWDAAGMRSHPENCSSLCAQISH